MDYKSLRSYVKAEAGVLITIIAVSIMVLSNNILMTIPFVLIASFLMGLIGVRAWTIVISAIVMHIILGITIDKWVSILILPTTIIEILGGFLFAIFLIKLIKNRKQTRYIILTIISLFLVYLGVIAHIDTFGKPLNYLKAKEGIQAYIDDTYEGKLEILGIKYSTKMNDYIANIESIEDRRNDGIIECGRSGRIYDDYHFRIEEKQSLQAEQLLLGMMKQKTDIPISDIRLGTAIDLPYNKYTARDMYLGEEPISIGITLEPDKVEDPSAYKEKYGKLPERHSYEDIEAFSKEAYKILKVLKDIDYPYKNIEIKSYLPDGERTYNITINGEIKINNIQNVLDAAHIKGSSK